MADYIFTQNGDGNVQIGDITGMPHHVNTALKWALEHNFQSVAAQYARTLALEIVRLREDDDRMYAALKLAQARAADMEAENERLRARWEETASDNTDYHLSHSDGIYTVSDQNGAVVCEFIRDAALEGGQHGHNQT